MVRAKASAPESKIELPLHSLIAAVDVDSTITFVADLRDQLDYQELARLWKPSPPSRQWRRSWVPAALSHIGADDRRSIDQYLRQLQRQGVVHDWKSVSIVNRIIVTGLPAVVTLLAARPEVAFLREENRMEPLAQESIGEEHIGSNLWSLEAIGAYEARKRGWTGKGIVVGIIDSGASAQHEQVQSNFRGGSMSWFDPVNQTSSPQDARFGHGTAVLSCAVGRDLGVAPSASWVAAAAFRGSEYSDVAITLSADWMLNVARPDVVVVSWRILSEDCDAAFHDIVNAWRAAGMVVVFAAGNTGPARRSDVSPANYGGLLLGTGTALSVGATDRELKIDPQSGRGPSRCSDAIYPQIVAPGVNVSVAFPLAASSYRTASGTSFAVGYAAGAAALLLEAFPTATPEMIEEALRASASDLGEPGPDSDYGFGMISIPAALDYLQRRRTH